jgi:hypothetical protein
MTSLELLKEIEAWLSFNTEPSKEEIAKLRKSIKEHVTEQCTIPVVVCCASCFKDIPENHFERRAYHDNEHCPNCGNDFLGSKWFSAPISKDKVEKIRAVLLA